MFPCRHHIFEIILRAVFDVKMGASSSPIALLFTRFQEKWRKLLHLSTDILSILKNILIYNKYDFKWFIGDIDIKNYKSAEDDDILNFRTNVSAEVLNFCTQQLQKQHDRNMLNS